MLLSCLSSLSSSAAPVSPLPLDPASGTTWRRQVQPWRALGPRRPATHGVARIQPSTPCRTSPVPPRDRTCSSAAIRHFHRMDPTWTRPFLASLDQLALSSSRRCARALRRVAPLLPARPCPLL